MLHLLWLSKCTIIQRAFSVGDKVRLRPGLSSLQFQANHQLPVFAGKDGTISNITGSQHRVSFVSGGSMNGSFARDELMLVSESGVCSDCVC